MGIKINQEGCAACFIWDHKQRFKGLQSLVYQASEQRQLEKSTRLQIDWSQGLEGAEERLYQSLMRAAGYSNYEEPFLRLAKRHSFAAEFGRPNPPEDPAYILGHWLGELGLLETKASHPTLERLQKSYKAMFTGEIIERVGSKGRPSNNPARRLTGMYYHFDQLKKQGLVKGWLRFFYQVERILPQAKHPRSEVMDLLDRQFPAPETEPLLHFPSFSSRSLSKHPSRLIGPERQRVILVNTVMPFFLAWATFSQDRNLERTLFRLYLLLPGEGKNYKTTAMETRLGVNKAPFKLQQNLACHQGLIQFYDQLCHTYYARECEGCPLPGWLTGL